MQFPYSSGREKRIYPRVSGENLPVRALRRLWRLDPRSREWALRRYEDDVGVIGFEVGAYMLLAKRRPYGYIVSFPPVHETLKQLLQRAEHAQRLNQGGGEVCARIS